jgi:hypothetical protein
MAYNSLSIDAIRPMNKWHHDWIQPGIVGSVGDVNCQVRLKHSSPDMPIRWDPEFSGVKETFLGSVVQDGDANSFGGGGSGPRVNDSNWQSGRSFKTRRGWRVEDIRAPDNMVEPFVSSLGDYTWRDKIATVYEARRTGNQFLPLPGQYQLSPGEMARGGSAVRVTDVAGGDEVVGVGNGSVMLNGLMDYSQATESPIPLGAYGRNIAPTYQGRMGGMPGLNRRG